MEKKAAAWGALWGKCKARMRADKKFEGAVYLAVMALIALVYLSLGGRPAARETAETTGGAGVEARLEKTLCAMQGVGDVRVMVTYDGEESVQGVIVIAEGAEDLAVQLRLRDAVRTVLRVESTQVEVFAMQEREAD